VNVPGGGEGRRDGVRRGVVVERTGRRCEVDVSSD
jgi:hypothetical protein